MIGANWKFIIRNIFKHKLLSFINVLGLAVGLASSLLIFLHVVHEYSYDRNWDKADNIYRVSYNRFQNGSLSFKSARSLRKMAPVLKEKIPEIIGSTELFKDVVTVYNENNQIQDIQMFVTDSSFFSVFHLDFIGKTGANPLSNLYSSVISESAALSLFGTTDAVGKWFKVCQGWRFFIAGVYKDLPSNTHIPFDLLLSSKTYSFYFQNWDNETGTEVIRNPDAHISKRQITSWDWGYNGCYTYILARPGADPKQIESEIGKIAADYTRKITQNGGKAEFRLQPVSGIHLKSNLEHEIAPNGDRNSVLALALIAVVILCIAWINYINLTLIRTVEHAKSIGIRKIAGAMKKQLVFQFLTEALATNLISIVIALCIVVLFKDWFSNISDMPLANAIGGKYLIILIALICAGIFVSGLYPAFYLSSFKPVDLFRGIHSSVSKNLDLRKFLVVVQFAASIILIAGVLMVVKQINYMKNRDLGINIDRTLVTYSPPTMIGRPQRMSKLMSYKSAIQNIAGVEAITTSSVIPGREILWKRQDVRKTDDLPSTMKTYAYAYIDYDFIKTFNIHLIAGSGYSNTESDDSNTLIINETAMNQLGFKNPGSAINSFVWCGSSQYKIVGVIKDFHQESLRKEIKPILFFYGYKWMSDIGYYSIKVNTTDLKNTIRQIEDTWANIYPEDHFKYFFLDNEFDGQYRLDRAFGKLFSLFTLLAIFIAGIGMFGLAVYTANQRTKEIGVRKVNGAGVFEILLMLNRTFLKWVALAFIIATPTAWYIIHKWLENFAFRTTVSWWIFALAGLLALGIALLTVSWQSWRAATRNPVDALRYE